MKRILSILLMICLTIPCFLFGGCGKKENQSFSSSSPEESTEEEVNDRLSGIPLEEVPGEYLVKQAKSEYKIVAKRNPGRDLATAISELQFFFKEATSIELPLVYDDEVTYSADAKYISLGANAYATGAGVSIEGKAVKSEGFYIDTVGKSIVIVGGSDIGTLYGVYGLLEREFHYDFFFTDTYSLDRNVINLPLKKYPSMVENPDIDTLQQNYGYITESTMNNYRAKTSKRTDAVVAVGETVTIHNILYILPPKEFSEEHPKWFTAENLCFTARGDETEYALMIEAAVEKSKIALTQSNALNICIGQPDLVGFCGCEACLAYAAENGGANSSVMIRFCNDLADGIYEWFATEEGKPYSRDLSVFFLAYQSVLASPTNYDIETDTYAPAGITCNEHVGVYFAADNYNFTVDMEHESNQTYVSAMKSWKVVADKFMFWFYDTNFACYMLPYDTFQAKTELYKFAKEMGAVSIFDEAQRHQTGSVAGWSILKCYLETKLRWDVNSNVNKLTEKFFKNCYGEDAEAMYDCYKEFRVLYRQAVAKKETGEIQENISSIFGQLVSRNIWPKSYLEKTLAVYTQALENAEELKEDPVKYAARRKLISSERISTLYLLLNIYMQYSEAEIAQQKAMFKEDLLNTGLTYETPSKTLDAFNAQLGISLY